MKVTQYAEFSSIDTHIQKMVTHQVNSSGVKLQNYRISVRSPFIDQSLEFIANVITD
ncbi:hypothetical protein [Polynucleobacter rarus]|uniref:hypothetical protein n=1 Tax=Polynucleobacter rarus TaxID=556055 RepID=UPI00131EFB28|nr:hypothetical protein [Polynucleobacter rarus]